MEYQNDKFQPYFEIVLDQFIELAESTYEVIEDINPNEWRLEKEQKVYEVIVSSFSRITSAPCWVWAYYKERDTFIYKAPGEQNEIDAPAEYKLSDFNLPSLGQASYIINKSNAHKWTLFSEIFTLHNLSSVLILPLRSTKQAELVGIAICGLQDTPINNSFILILEKLSVQAALAVDHARLIERLSTLENVSASMSKEANTLGILRLILDEALDLPRFSTGQLYLADIAREYLYLVVWRGDDTPKQSIYFGQGILGNVAKDGKPKYIPNLSEVDRKNDLEENSFLPENGSSYSVPIIAGAELLGVLNLVSTKPNAFTKLDLYIINSFAKLAAIAIWGFLRMMEVAYIDLQTASEQHAWGTNIITIDIASDVIYQRLKNNEIDNETIETAEELLLSSQRGYKRIMDIYNAFSQGRTLGSPLLKPTWRIEPVPIYSVLNNLVQELQPDFHENNIDVKITSSAELVDVNGVSPMLQIAFREMLCNSIEAIQKNKEDNADRLITIIMSSDPKKDLIIEIQDTGIGIPFEDRGKIFNTDYSSKRKTGGIGLKLAKMVFDQHNGSIELKTVNGMGETDMNGCTFIINLPCRKGCKS